MSFMVANHNSYRDMAKIAHEASQFAKPPIVVSNNLIHGFHYLGRDVTLFITKHLIARGGQAFFQIPKPNSALPFSPGEPVGAGIFDENDFERRLQFYELEIVTKDVYPDPQCSSSSLRYIIRKA